MNEAMNVNTVEIRAVVPIEAVDNALSNSYNEGYEAGCKDTTKANEKAAKRAAAASTIGGLAAVAGIGLLAHRLWKHFKPRTEETGYSTGETVNTDTTDTYVFEED